VTAARLGLLACHTCGVVSRPLGGTEAACPRCGTRLRIRIPDSLARTIAFLTAAAVMFVPANALPVLTTRSLARSHADTILSGVVVLWKAGSWPLAVLVFVASIVVPGLKIASLSLLVASTARHSTWRRLARTRLYRLLETVGRWSMLDVFVMGLLAAIVHSPLAGVQIEAGALAFAAVVILTMLASLSFDPRLIWDSGEDRRE
jgi:paraquat-inducible protein A